MKSINIHLLAASLFTLTSACGSLTGGGQDLNGSSSTDTGSSGSGATSSSGAANCGNANSANPNGTDPNQTAGNGNQALDPNAFAYVYQTQDPNTAGQPGAEIYEVFTMDPNACDTGSLLLKEGQPTLTVHFSNYHRVISSSFQLNQEQASKAGQCNLYGGDFKSAPHQVSGQIIDNGSEPDQYSHQYELTIDGKKATLQQWSTTTSEANIRAKQCSFPTESSALVPCRQ